MSAVPIRTACEPKKVSTYSPPIWTTGVLHVLIGPGKTVPPTPSVPTSAIVAAAGSLAQQSVCVASSDAVWSWPAVAAGDRRCRHHTG
ncbi:hypothetical protein [Microbacterium deminutum]|uniref:hypothetical protein n=1 Tax=Microbacterium deminutum TaxID=344164 RepID=UPI0031E3A8D0